MYKVIVIGLLLCSIQLSAQKDTTQFVTTWRTYNPGISGDSSILLRTNASYTYNYDVDWNDDGVFDSLGVTGDITHRYSDTGTYTIRIKGTYPAVSFGSTFIDQDNKKLLSIDQWGTTAWQDFTFAFKDCINLSYNATDIPNFSFPPSLRHMFNGSSFNGNISNWDMSTITNVSGMFARTTAFNRDLSAWDVSSVVLMGGMFTNALVFNNNITTWDLSSVINIDDMFRNATAFNQNIGIWDVSNILEMEELFSDATSFNQDISSWDVDSVYDMDQMFRNATAFNQNISSWDVRNAVDMSSMFFGASAFNQDLRRWDVQNVGNMSGMFRDAISFNQNLGAWDIFSVNNMGFMLNNSGLSINNYDSTLIGWQAKVHPFSINLGAVGLEYCLSDSVRNILVTTGSWTITGDSKNCTTVGIEDSNKKADSFMVYPNPSTGVFKIELAKEEIGIPLIVYNNTGQLIQEIQNPKKQQSIDLSHIKEGLYVLRWGTETRKILMIKD